MGARRQLLNAIPNVIWTAMFALPVYRFCDVSLSPAQRFAVLLLGSAGMLLPKSLMRRTQLSQRIEVYRRIGTPLLLRWTQDSAWLHRTGGVTEPRVRHDRNIVQNLLRSTWTRERFHLGLFLLCGACSLVALWRFQILWCIGLFAVNLLYNVYPIWLQQYLRLRLERLTRGWS